jgi:hypothetical protein
MKPKTNSFNDADNKRKRSPVDIFSAGKPDDQVIKESPVIKEEIATTIETNVIPMIKDENPKIEYQQPEEPVGQPEETKITELKTKKSSLTIEVDFEDDAKTNCTFTLRQSTINLIEESINKMKQQNGKAKINKSKLVDKILREAFSDLEVVYNKK